MTAAKWSISVQKYGRVVEKRQRDSTCCCYTGISFPKKPNFFLFRLFHSVVHVHGKNHMVFFSVFFWQKIHDNNRATATATTAATTNEKKKKYFKRHTRASIQDNDDEKKKCAWLVKVNKIYGIVCSLCHKTRK